MSGWEQVVTSVSAGTTALTLAGHFLMKLSKVIRGVLATVTAVKELAMTMHSHLDTHKVVDEENRQRVEGVISRLKVVENDVADLKVIRRPHLRKPVPTQPSHTE